MNDRPDESAKTGGTGEADSVTSAQSDKGQARSQAASEGLQQLLEELKVANADLRDKLLRNMAEMENFRRRSEREKADLAKYAVSDFARDMVSIGDNLRRAIEAVKKDAIEKDPVLKTLVEGVEVTERELLKVFERYGITRFDPTGEKFDPHFHEAMIRVDVPNLPANVVVQVLHAGYKIGDRVLRPAAVIVSKGAPAVQAQNGRQQAEAQPSMSAEQAGDATESAPPNAGDMPEAEAAQASSQKLHSGQGTKERSQGEKRSSTVTKPVTDSPPNQKDDLISSFGKRLENGN
jgi:molecular chaperone GrpE